MAHVKRVDAFTQVIGVVGEEHDGVYDAPCDWNLETTAPEQRHRSGNAKANRDVLREGQPPAVFHALTATGQSRDGECAGDEAAEDSQGPDEPDDARRAHPPGRSPAP